MYVKNCHIYKICDVINFYVFGFLILPLIFTVWCLSLQNITVFILVVIFVTSFTVARTRCAPDRWTISWDYEADPGFRTSWSISLGSLMYGAGKFLLLAP